MKTLFSTFDLHPRDRFDQWHAAASANILGHDGTPLSRLTFQAELQAGALGDIGLVLFRNSPMDVLYGRSHIGQADTDRMLVCTLKSGKLWLSHGGSETCLEAGDLLLIDPAFPYTARFSLDSG